MESNGGTGGPRTREPVPGEFSAGAPGRVLDALRECGPLTAEEIAGRVRTGRVAVRAHLRALEAAGLVTRREERRPVGRPVARFRLTARADARFTKRYDLFASRLLDAVVAAWGPEGLERILATWEDDLHGALDARLPEEPGARLEGLCAHQNEHGFMASVRSDASGVALVERNCPILALASRHPEICRHEATLFGRTLRWKTALVSCQATGDDVCVFRIGRAPSRGTAARPDRTTDGKE